MEKEANPDQYQTARNLRKTGIESLRKNQNKEKQVSQKEVNFPYKTYVLNGVVLVPHYAKEMWVGPNYHRTKKEWSEEELHKLKAKPSKEMLWHRNKHKMLD